MTLKSIVIIIIIIIVIWDAQFTFLLVSVIFSPYNVTADKNKSAMFELYRIAFVPARKPYRIGLLFTQS